MTPGFIPFNKPFFVGTETEYLRQAVAAGHLSGDGAFTRRCHAFLEQRWGFGKALLTTSATSALEMAALLVGIGPGDEVIMPAFTFVSTANAFVLRGARVVFADSLAGHPNLDVASVAALITPRTRALVAVHYAGVPCDMAPLLALGRQHDIPVIEDAAQALGSFYQGQPAGTLGQLAAFSFHETKNVSAGEGGLLTLADPAYFQAAEIIREKGTNRSAFFRGEIDKYNWVSVGSSYLPSEATVALLWAQLEQVDFIQQRRLAQWGRYHAALVGLAGLGVGLPTVPDYATANGHLYFLVCRSLAERSALIRFLRERDILAVFHYQALHRSPYYTTHHPELVRALPQAERYSACLLRLPLFHALTEAEQQRVLDAVLTFYHSIYR
jgi:dTDP-4-amino-4,6-dideoxygalactose transaminase